MATVTIESILDTTVEIHDPNDNAHSTSANTVSASWTSGYGDYRNRALFQFNISAYSGLNITAAELQVTGLGGVWTWGGTNYPSGNRTYYFERNLAQFTETTTYNTRPSITTTNRVTKNDTNIENTETWYLNVLSMLEDAIAASQSYLGITVRDSVEVLTYGMADYSFETRHSSVVADRPKLVLTYVADDYYVKTTGDDTKDGTSWTNAWATINKAATTVADGKTVHIGHGTYNSEPAGNTIAPVNAASLGIKYKPETADTGAEVAGSVTIENN